MSEADYRIECYQGAEIEQVLDEFAPVLVRVYRAFPYLFDGDEDYEKAYLKSYIDDPNSLIIIVRYGDKVVGGSTCIPLESEEESFYKPVENAGVNPHRVIYLGDSVLDAEHRGRGFGVEFFRIREEHGRKLGRDKAMFCSVKREANHPMKPKDYVPLDQFWKKRGYRPTGLVTSYIWKDRNESSETSKTLEYWLKDDLTVER